MTRQSGFLSGPVDTQEAISNAEERNDHQPLTNSRLTEKLRGFDVKSLYVND